MAVAQKLTNLPPDVQDLLDRVPADHMHDLAMDLAWAALVAPRRPDALYQVVREWEVTLEEIALAGSDLGDIQRARQEARDGVGMSPGDLRTYLDDDR